jgi:hypothetical protein
MEVGNGMALESVADQCRSVTDSDMGNPGATAVTKSGTV